MPATAVLSAFARSVIEAGAGALKAGRAEDWREAELEEGLALFHIVRRVTTRLRATMDADLQEGVEAKPVAARYRPLGDALAQYRAVASGWTAAVERQPPSPLLNELAAELRAVDAAAAALQAKLAETLALFDRPRSVEPKNARQVAAAVVGADADDGASFEEMLTDLGGGD
jgi:hypothetical protein